MYIVFYLLMAGLYRFHTSHRRVRESGDFLGDLTIYDINSATFNVCSEICFQVFAQRYCLIDTTVLAKILSFTIVNTKLSQFIGVLRVFKWNEFRNGMKKGKQII